MIHTLLNAAGIPNGTVLYDSHTGEPLLANGQPIPPTILADWRIKNAAEEVVAAADQAAEAYAEQLDRRAKYVRALQNAPQKHIAALIRLRDRSR